MNKLIDILNKACGEDTWFTVCGLDYDTLIMKEGFTKPSLEVWNKTIDDISTEYDNLSYMEKRANEYPPITEYLDGIVKNDQSQIDAYISACQAVKLKYPKP